MREPRRRPGSNHLLSVRAATLQSLATCPVVKIVFMACSPDYSVKLRRGMRALWSLASTTLVGFPCLVVLLANHRGLGSKRVSGFERRLLVCRLSGLSPYVGGDRAG